MKAVVVYEAGGPEKLIYQEVSKPKLKPGWSLVKVKASGINHSEIFTRQGLSPGVRFPRVPGIECAGVIESSTEEKRLPPGQKVISMMGEMGRLFDGGYAEYVLLPNEQIYPVASDLPWPALGAVPETFFTAYGSMKNLQIRPADKILVRGGTSGVGLAFLKLVKARHKNIQVDGTSRNLAKRKHLLETGFDDVIEDQSGKLTGNKTYDKILELIGPKTVKDSFLHVKSQGIVCSTGQLGGQWFLEEFDPITDIRNNSYLTGFYSGSVNQETVDEMMDYIDFHQVEVKPERVFRLSEIQKAHEYLESKESFGKAVVVTD